MWKVRLSVCVGKTSVATVLRLLIHHTLKVTFTSSYEDVSCSPVCTDILLYNLCSQISLHVKEVPCHTSSLWTLVPKALDHSGGVAAEGLSGSKASFSFSFKSICPPQSPKCVFFFFYPSQFWWWCILFSWPRSLLPQGISVLQAQLI